jgi:hypothetical protein
LEAAKTIGAKNRRRAFHMLLLFNNPKLSVNNIFNYENIEFVPNSVEIESDSSGYSLIDYR